MVDLRVEAMTMPLLWDLMVLLLLQYFGSLGMVTDYSLGLPGVLYLSFVYATA